MPIYRYRAITEKGAVVEGIAPAASRLALTEELSRKGLFPSEIHRAVLTRVTTRVTDDEMLFFVGELASLAQAGIPIPEALGVIAEQPGRSHLLNTIAQVRTEIHKGAALSEALSHYPAIFDRLFLALVRIGERSGALSPALRQYHKLLEQRVALKRKVRQALIYPAFILALTVTIIAVLLFFSLPRFTELYADLGADLPGPTQALLAVVSAVTQYGWLAVVAIIALVLGIRRWTPRQHLKQIYENIMQRLPLVGPVNEYYALSLCCHALQSLLASGITVSDALRHVAEIVPTLRHANSMTCAAERITHGVGLISALRTQGIFSPSALKLIEAGVKSGTITAQFHELGRYYDRLLDQRMSNLIAMFEPVLILVTGIIVGAAVVAMYLPIFGMTGAL